MKLVKMKLNSGRESQNSDLTLSKAVMTIETIKNLKNSKS